jgi:hypothetical protein
VLDHPARERPHVRLELLGFQLREPGLEHDAPERTQRPDLPGGAAAVRHDHDRGPKTHLGEARDHLDAPLEGVSVRSGHVEVGDEDERDTGLAQAGPSPHRRVDVARLQDLITPLDQVAAEEAPHHLLVVDQQDRALASGSRGRRRGRPRGGARAAPLLVLPAGELEKHLHDVDSRGDVLPGGLSDAGRSRRADAQLEAEGPLPAAGQPIERSGDPPAEDLLLVALRQGGGRRVQGRIATAERRHDSSVPEDDRAASRRRLEREAAGLPPEGDDLDDLLQGEIPEAAVQAHELFFQSKVDASKPPFV